MKNYTAYFKVKAYDSCKNVEEEFCGFIPADSFMDAAAELEKYFRKEIISVTIELLCTNLMIMSEEMAKQIISLNVPNK